MIYSALLSEILRATNPIIHNQSFITILFIAKIVKVMFKITTYNNINVDKKVNSIVRFRCMESYIQQGPKLR